MRLTVCLGVAAILAGSRADELQHSAAVAVDPVDNLLEAETSNKILQEQCSSKHPMSCLKLTLIRGLDRLSRWPSSMELAPGFTVKGDLSTLQELPRDVRSSQLDEALLRSLTRYLSSLSLTVRVMDSGTVRKMQEMGETLTRPVADQATPKARKPAGGPLMMAGMMSGGTLLALGLAAIAAMAGKAMMAALLSLMMSAMAAMRGGGGGGGDKSSYEVIHAHDHKHRSLDVTGAGDASFAYPDFSLPPAMRRGFVTPVNTRRR